MVCVSLLVVCTYIFGSLLLLSFVPKVSFSLGILDCYFLVILCQILIVSHPGKISSTEMVTVAMIQLPDHNICGSCFHVLFLVPVCTVSTVRGFGVSPTIWSTLQHNQRPRTTQFFHTKTN